MMDISLPSFTDTPYSQLPVRVPLADRTAWLKRTFDIVVSALLLLVILSWLLPLISLLVRLSSPGPSLFVQLRMGRGGIPFRCLKFRTMTYTRDAEFRQAVRNDSRVTKLGAFLRRTSLDELPQLINVLLGQMSLVGPRPHPLRLDAQYWHTMPNYIDRYAIRPGLTGLAQSRGCRGETGQLIQMQHRVRYDLLYIRRQSFRLDLQICLWTLLNMVKGDEKAW
ncbi:MAG: sugar transferase [Hymenobacter sp.]|nr:MAG: sugar transferase [Hymenobacter sp.]